MDDHDHYDDLYNSEGEIIVSIYESEDIYPHTQMSYNDSINQDETSQDKHK